MSLQTTSAEYYQIIYTLNGKYKGGRFNLSREQAELEKSNHLSRFGLYCVEIEKQDAFWGDAPRIGDVYIEHRY